MQTQESITKREPAKRTASVKKTFDFNEAIDGLRGGLKKSESVSLFEGVVEKLSQEQRKPLIQFLVEKEGCSEAFAERFLTESKFRKRVSEVCRNFSENGERMNRMEEAEIFTELMEPGHDDISALLKSTDPSRRFKGLKPINQDELRELRLKDFNKDVKERIDPKDANLVQGILRNAFEQVGVNYTGSEQDWDALFAKPDRLQHFLAMEEVREVYEIVTEGKKVHDLKRSIQLTWREMDDGSRMPSLNIKQHAMNPETKSITELGFRIEKEPVKGSQGETQRVLKNIHIAVDKDVRGKGEGTSFLLSNLNLIKSYNLKEAEIYANIKLGSFVWTRLSDLDVPTMSDELSSLVQKELGPKPWDEKVARGLIYREQILPKFEANLHKAVTSVLDSIKDSRERSAMRNILEGDLLGKQYSTLRERALAGEISIEELANLGKGLDVFRFDDEGEIQNPDNQNAKHDGHLGKAGIMGVPWTARLPLDTRSLFGVVDKLSKGSGFTSFIKKTGQKLGLAIKL